MAQPQPPVERRVYLRGIALPLSVAEALIADARRAGDGIADALERALRDGRFAPRTGSDPDGSITSHIEVDSR